MLAGVGAGVLALALAVPYYVKIDIKAGGAWPPPPPPSTTATRSSIKEHHLPEEIGTLVTRVAVMSLCLIVIVIRIVIPFSTIQRARDPFRTAEPGGGRIVLVL